MLPVLVPAQLWYSILALVSLEARRTFGDDSFFVCGCFLELFPLGGFILSVFGSV